MVKKMDIMQGILKSFKMLITVLGLIGAGYLTLMVITLVLGVAFNIALSGQINVSTTTTTSMNNSFNAFITLVGYINTAYAFAGGLITLAILIMVLGGVVGFGVKEFKSYKKGGKSEFFDGGKSY
jgi:hypothetical protein